MKFKTLIKATPLYFTLLLIIFLSITNQKEYTKVKILIWNTPSLTLGKYLAISTGTGFLFSYFITTYFVKTGHSIPKQSLKFKIEDNNENINENIESTSYTSYDNTLIERDLNDPSPTVNASFRVIGRQDRRNSNFLINDDIEQYDESTEIDDQYFDKPEINESINKVESIACDWSDESYLKW